MSVTQDTVDFIEVITTEGKDLIIIFKDSSVLCITDKGESIGVKVGIAIEGTDTSGEKVH